jgi:hypothetical protein
MFVDFVDVICESLKNLFFFVHFSWNPKSISHSIIHICIMTNINFPMCEFDNFKSSQ